MKTTKVYSNCILIISLILLLGNILTKSCSQPLEVEQNLNQDFIYIKGVLRFYHDEYGSYPVSLKEAVDNSLFYKRRTPNIRDWSYTIDSTKDAYNLKNMQYSGIRTIDTTDREDILQAYNSPDECLREESLNTLKGQKDGLQLIKKVLLSDPSPGVRSRAAFDIGQEYPKSESKPALYQALLDPDFGVWECVARALDYLRDSTVVDELVTMSDSPDIHQRIQAARGLCDMETGHRKIWPVLSRLMDDTDQEVRLSAVISYLRFSEYREYPPPSTTTKNDYVDKIQAKLIKGLKDKNHQFQIECARALGKKAYPEAYPLVKEAFQSSVTTLQVWQDIWTLNNYTTQDVVYLFRTYMDSTSPWVRHGIAMMLFQRVYPEKNEDMLKMLHDTSPLVRKQVLNCLNSSTDTIWIPYVLEMFQDPDAEVRAAAVTALGATEDCSCYMELLPSALGRLKDSRTIIPITKMLKDSDGRVRLAAAITLSYFQKIETAKALIDSLTDTEISEHSISVGYQCIYALQQMHAEIPIEKMRDAILLAQPYQNQYTYEFINNFPQKEELKQLIQKEIPKRLKSENKLQIIGALTMYSHFQFTGIEQKIISLSYHPSRDVRSSACQALSNYLAPEWHTRLYELVKDRDQGVKTTAACSLPKFQNPEDIDILIKIYHELRTNDYDGILNAINSFNSPKVLPFLIDVVKDGNVWCLWRTCYCLTERFHKKQLSITDIQTLIPILEKRINEISQVQRDPKNHPAITLLKELKGLGEKSN